MVFAVRSLLTGLITGLVLALLLHEFVPTIQRQTNTQVDHPLPLPDPRSMAQVLKNSLQAARRRAWAAGGYKSSSSLRPSTPSFLSSLSQKPRTFSATTLKMSATKSFAEAANERRTYYQLNNKAPISDKQITDIAEQALLHTPSSFNSQSTRLVVLLNNDHEKFWDFVLEVLKPLTPEDKFDGTKQRISGFRAAKGTILFYEDPEPVENLRKGFPLYAHHFGTWSEHTSAMHQYALWVGLEAQGFGASLQHYNPIIDQRAAEEWSIPLDWKLTAQLVFGGRAGEPGEKQFQETHGKRLFVHGAQ
ncbi:hypothetical protein NX059_011673 [Plenodomus lindquistii]|nr:hypothetical protein NX059_011673 [Plenodomus lindquistii]